MLSFDPIFGTEMMEVLGISHDELSIPKNMSKFNEVLAYFKDYPSASRKVLSLTANKPGDRLETVWTWVKLHEKREKVVGELSPEDFAEDVAKEIASKKLPKEHKERVRRDVNELKLRREKEARYNEDAKNAVSKFDLDKVEAALDEVDLIDGMLDKF